MAVTDVAEVSAGGSPMPIYTARPDGDGKSAAVIVIQEIFGVNNDVRSIADRFADAGATSRLRRSCSTAPARAWTSRSPRCSRPSGSAAS